MSDVLRTIVRGAYDVQKLRIQMGNRICGNFKARLGQKPGKKEDTLEDGAKKVLKVLRVRFKKLTDGVKSFPRRDDFQGDEVICDYTELCLIRQYLELEKHEEDHFKMMGRTLLDYPIHAQYLLGVKGVGPAMAGVLLSELDVTKARYPSSFHSYAGLDVVRHWDMVELYDESKKPLPFLRILPDHYKPTDDGFILLDAEDGEKIARYQIVDSGRSKRKEHLREIEYKDKDGKTKTRMGITFNPFLKTKLIGVLGPSFLKVGREYTVAQQEIMANVKGEDDREIKANIKKWKSENPAEGKYRSPYAGMYYDYRSRMEAHERWGIHNDDKLDEKGHKVTSKGRRHNMAIRYAVKAFLTNLHIKWRGLSGLPVSQPYHVSKLGYRSFEEHQEKEEDAA